MFSEVPLWCDYEIGSTFKCAAPAVFFNLSFVDFLIQSRYE